MAALVPWWPSPPTNCSVSTEDEEEVTVEVVEFRLNLNLSARADMGDETPVEVATVSTRMVLLAVSSASMFSRWVRIAASAASLERAFTLMT